MKTTIIIFSKNRTLQLKSLLLSLRANSDIPENQISIIYKCDIPSISYAPLKHEFKANFIEQKDFLTDVKNIVSYSDSDYFLFMVDDLIANRRFLISDIETFMNAHPEVDSFCLRMGKNIKCGTTPEFIPYGKGIIAWDTSLKWGKHWNYVWEVSSSLYRRSLVEEYLKKCRPEKESFPNPFEDHFYQCMPNTTPNSLAVRTLNSIRLAFRRKIMRIACFEKTKCFTQGVNVVADIQDGRTQQFDPQTLHEKMLEGYFVDYLSLRNVLPEQPNAGDKFFRLTRKKNKIS